MQTTIVNYILLILLVYTTFSCTATRKPGTISTGTNIASLRLLDEYDVPYNLSYNNTIVGGLSGIDHDAVNDHYYLISDDRSAKNPARFYKARILVSTKGIDSFYFIGAHPLKRPGGDYYPNTREDPFSTPDPEAIRYHPHLQQLVWSSEGERILNGRDTILADPTINIIDTGGAFMDSIQLPAMLQMTTREKGPRQNSVLEGLTFAADYKTMYASVEEPLYEDGPKADTSDNKAFIRLLKFDFPAKKSIAQFAYKLEPVAYPEHPPGKFKINGVSDILDLGNDRLLVVERSFSTGRLACTIKIFIADLKAATDIKNIPSLKKAGVFTPATKKLLLNMDDLGIFIDNIEGVTFGPVLPNGHKTLLFVSDNNFNPLEKTQVLLFEVIE